MGASGLIGVAGCITEAFGDDSVESAVLDPPPDQRSGAGDLPYPSYGDPFPEFELPDPLTEETVDVAEIDECIVCTAFYATCPAECVPLMHSMSILQADAIAAGFGDRVRFLGITFDPERDTPEALREHADMIDVDLDAGNWHYLRPADHEEAKRIVAEDLGYAFEREEVGSTYDFIHATITYLVNPNHIVERAYLGENPDNDQLYEDLESVVDRWEWS